MRPANDQLCPVERLAAFLALFQEDHTPLHAFDLSTYRGRCDFLWRLSVLGESGLFAAVAHVWKSLAPPKAFWCATMAHAASIRATRKNVLLQLLSRFIFEFNALETSPLPEEGEF